MKKTKLLASLCALVLTICTLAIGVFAAVKAEFSATGSITFNASQCLVDVQIDIKGITASSSSITSSATATADGITEVKDATTGIVTRTMRFTTLTSSYNAGFDATANFGSSSFKQAVALPNGALALGDLTFNELNVYTDTNEIEGKAAGYWNNHIEITISAYSYSNYEVKMDVDLVTGEGTLAASEATLALSDENTKYAAIYTIGTPTAITKTVTITGVGAVSGSKSLFSVSIQPGEKPMPTKGQLITMELGEDETDVVGMKNQYRILSINGTTAEVVAMYDASRDLEFNNDDSGGPGAPYIPNDELTQSSYESPNFAYDSSTYGTSTYNNGILDTYLNETWYATLSASAKAAIVDNTFTQDVWDRPTTQPSSGTYYAGNYTYDNNTTNYWVVNCGNTRGSTTFTEVTKHIYALSVQDVLDYLGVTTSMTSSDTTLTSANLWTMFWNTSTQPGNDTCPWLRSSCSSYVYHFAWHVDSYDGELISTRVNFSAAARPAFKIDLSKIAWA